MKTILLILLSIAAFATSKPTRLHFQNLFKPQTKANPNPRIIAGQEAEPHSLPYQVFLAVYNPFEGWYCGGSLISTNYILTAAQCNDQATYAYVTLGAHKPLETEDTQVVLRSQTLINHEDFNPYNYSPDIGLIKLPESVIFTDAIKPVALPSGADSTYVGVTAKISGWGTVVGLNNDLSDVLNYVDVEVISNEECEDSFGGLPDFAVCTSGKNYGGACSGDNGGPLVADGVQIGIVSFVYTLCYPGFPSGFMRVTSFLDWIRNNSDVLN